MKSNFDSNISNKKLARFAWFVVAYNLLVIIWGAFVRASKSGDGCGVSYPLCNGMIVPHAAEIKTLVEFMHRVSTAPALILVIILVVWTFRRFPRKHLARKMAALSLFFILTEGAIGAALVLYRMVAHDDSVERVFSMSAHLVNTFILLAVLALTAVYASGKRLIIRSNEISAGVYAVLLAGMILVGMSGAVAALGDTLFPSVSLAEGLRKDFSETAHYLIRLRVWHPVLSITVGCLAALVAAWQLRQKQISDELKRISIAVIALVAAQLVAGVINVLLLAPIWMQLVHLLLADLLWISLILLAANNLSESAETDGEIETAKTALKTAEI